MMRPFFIVLLMLIIKSSFAEEVTFITQDNATIYANFQLRGPHAVILAHGAIFDKESWGGFEQRLLQENYTVLAIDFRGYNKSTQGSKKPALHEDILAAVQFLKSQKSISKITLLGASMGGSAAAKASVYSKPQSIDQLILLSPASVFNPKALKGNILFIASKKEPMAKSIQSYFEKTQSPKKLILIKGNAHAQHIFKTPQAKKLTRIILNFLKSGALEK